MSESIKTITNRIAKRAGEEMNLDAALIWSDNTAQIAMREAHHWADINLARIEAGLLTWDGLVLEATYRANGETVPELKREALEDLALVAVACIASLDRQVEELQEALDSGDIPVEEVASDDEDD